MTQPPCSYYRSTHKNTVVASAHGQSHTRGKAPETEQIEWNGRNGNGKSSAFLNGMETENGISAVHVSKASQYRFDCIATGFLIDQEVRGWLWQWKIMDWGIPQALSLCSLCILETAEGPFWLSHPSLNNATLSWIWSTFHVTHTSTNLSTVVHHSAPLQITFRLWKEQLLVIIGNLLGLLFHKFKVTNKVLHSNNNHSSA